jgi:hypothetical protein
MLMTRYLFIKMSPSNDPTVSLLMPAIDPKDLIVRTFLKQIEADGHVHAIIRKDAEMKRDPDHIQFLCDVDSNTSDDIYTYQALDFI